jgi:hypothetical protein
MDIETLLLDTAATERLASLAVETDRASRDGAALVTPRE